MLLLDSGKMMLWVLFLHGKRVLLMRLLFMRWGEMGHWMLEGFSC